jgi:MFS transporter, UMF1 family
MSSFRESSTSNRSSSYSNDANNEADDERSWGSPPTMSRPGDHSSTTRYDGEDTRPTSNKELRGFYAYSWASEVFVICGMGSFIPITLEQLAREKGVLASDHKTPCVPGAQPPPGSPNSTWMNAAPPRHEAQQCLLPILGMEINTASFAMYTFSISVFVQFLIIISMSGAADHGNYRKMLLVIFAFTGALATTLFLPIQPHTVILGAIFAIIANTCYGASSVLLNSFLPLLVRYHPDVQAENITSSDEYGVTPETITPEENSIHDTSMADPSTSLLGHRHKGDVGSFSSELASLELTTSTRISSIGMGIGYISALLVQVLAIYIVWAIKSTLFSLRLVLFIIGIWWIVFTIPAAMWLRPRPGPPLHLPVSTSRFRTAMAYATYSWKSLGRSIMRARKLKDVLFFLAAWFLLSDAIATVSGTAVLFAKTSLEMKPAALALITMVVTLAGIVGAFAWPRISALMGLKPIHTILFCIGIFEIIPLYGLLGYIPIIRRWGVGGLQQGWEM